MPVNRTFTLIRHMQAKFPEGLEIDSQKWDAIRPPTAEGRTQVQKLLGELEDANDKFMLILHSDVLRTEFLANQLPLIETCEVLPVPELKDPLENTVEYAILWKAYLLYGNKTAEWVSNPLVAPVLRKHGENAAEAIEDIIDNQPVCWKDYDANVAIVGHGVYLVSLAMALCQSREHDAFLSSVNMGECDRLVVSRKDYVETIRHIPLSGKPKESVHELERPPYL